MFGFIVRFCLFYAISLLLTQGGILSTNPIHWYIMILALFLAIFCIAEGHFNASN